MVACPVCRALQSMMSASKAKGKLFKRYHHHLLSLWYTVNFSNAFGRCVCPLPHALLNKFPLLSLYALSVLPTSFIKMEWGREGEKVRTAFSFLGIFVTFSAPQRYVSLWEGIKLMLLHVGIPTHWKSKAWRSCWCVSKLHLPQGNTFFFFLGEMTLWTLSRGDQPSLCVGCFHLLKLQFPPNFLGTSCLFWANFQSVPPNESQNITVISVVCSVSVMTHKISSHSTGQLGADSGAALKGSAPCFGFYLQSFTLEL